ncbi:hypothetical protein DFR50_12953 [Roseiarcus fermentans]|uniref:Major facilitator superfamily (MFS) profile domain-containing protein n=1 Tax=Roseiarcus fermentans TaxID=1473586 RepID=A0A366EXJ7_9HYPH|nr:hypothetical protein [Roseiarcus fermentans]RBP07123.1 hypothetical protein DFR50_12953 [Roseiarcus fermentans]
MTTFPVVLFATAAAALGAYLLLLWFRKERKPVLIGFHVLLGLGVAESLAAILHLGGLDDDDALKRLALVAGAFLMAALASGVSAPLFGKAYRNTANTLLAVHVAAGLAAVLIVFVVAARR